MNPRPQRLAFPLALMILSLNAFPAQPAAPAAPAPAPATGSELREGSLDMVILLDKSLSMAPFFEKAKAYAAGNLIESILAPGDRLIVEAVYGKTDRLISTTIGSDADKAAAIRTIRAVKANGRFTDLGSALDVAKRDLDELGKPEVPKYVVLITDERQEAPAGSPYQAADHRLKHPSLEYVKKVDLGKFRAITVGLQVGPKVSEAAPAVMQLLAEPPARGGASGGTAGARGAAGGGPGAGAAPEAGVTSSERALPSWLFYAAGGVLLLALAGLAVAMAVSRKRREKIEPAA